MTQRTFTVAVGAGRISGRAEVGRPGFPLLVCIPGGSYNAHYFDIPGHSLFDAARDEGFSIVALDRPGYGQSDALVGELSFKRNAEVLAAAIGDIWREHANSASGVVLIGHSIGGAIAVHIASHKQPWPLLGISVTSIHTDAPDQIAEAWNAIPSGTVLEFTAEQRVHFMYGPEGTFDPAVVTEANISTSPIPVEELEEVVGRWVSDFARLAPSVSVPVHYALAEHEQLWVSTDTNVRTFSQAFTSAPFVSAERVIGAGHNIDHHLNSRTFHEGQLEFARAAAKATH